MADLVKQLGQFSVDGIHVAINSALTEDEIEALTEILKKLCQILPEASSKAVVKRKVAAPLPSSKDVFQSKILPLVRERVAAHINNETKSVLEIGSVMNFKVEYNTLTLNQLMEVHTQILVADAKVTQLQLLVRFQRGMLYLEVASRFSGDGQFKDWIFNTLNISYDVAQRYMTVALLIRRCPRLLICGLSFDQLSKHNKNFVEYFLVEKEGLHDSLAVAYEVNIQGEMLKIRPSEVQVPPLAYKTLDPDSSYYLTEHNEDPSQSISDDWMPTVNNKQAKLLWPSDVDEEEIEILIAMTTACNVNSLAEGLQSIARIGSRNSSTRALEYKKPE